MVNHYPEHSAIETARHRNDQPFDTREGDHESEPLSAYEKGSLNLSELLACGKCSFHFP
jgi:hypothetical protein